MISCIWRQVPNVLSIGISVLSVPSVSATPEPRRGIGLARPVEPSSRPWLAFSLQVVPLEACVLRQAIVRHFDFHLALHEGDDVVSEGLGHAVAVAGDAACVECLLDDAAGAGVDDGGGARRTI